MPEEKQHLSGQTAEDFRKQIMPADERRKWERHMSFCTECLERVYGGQSSGLASESLAQAFTLREDENFHLSAQELQRYMSGSMDEADRVIFESHLEGCAMCGAKAATLARRNEQDATTRRMPPKPSPQELSRPWRWPRRVLFPGVAAAVLLVGCVLLVWSIWHRQSRSREPAGQKAAGRTIILSIRDDGKEITLDKEGTLAGLERLDTDKRDTLREALVNGLSEPRVLAELSTPPIKLMGPVGNPSPFSLLGPVSTLVEEQQPVLRWEPLADATGYVAAVFNSQFQLVAKSRQQPGTEWQVSEPLQRDVAYFWQVTAHKGRQQITVPVAPASRAEFRVLDSRSAADLERAKALAPNSHLTLGILYADAGLRESAESELEALAKENPRSPEVQKLLRQVQSWKH